ncbi:MAG: hypothetical protein QXI91_07645 [Candidatus Bathyarchaeia archaeon]
MKEFVIEDFYELSESDVGKDYVFVKATVWLRSAFQSWEGDVKSEELSTVVEPLKRHGFTVARIRETAIPIK